MASPDPGVAMQSELSQNMSAKFIEEAAQS